MIVLLQMGVDLSRQNMDGTNCVPLSAESLSKSVNFDSTGASVLPFSISETCTTQGSMVEVSAVRTAMIERQNGRADRVIVSASEKGNYEQP